MFAAKENNSCPAQGVVEDLEEYLAILSKYNSDRIREVEERRINCSFIDQRSVEFIFMVSDRFHLTPDVRYSAVCLFDASLWEYVAENSRTEESFRRDWNTLQTKLAGQVALRALSCIQIASKLSRYATQLDIASVKDFLKCMGFHYTEKQILTAELRVLKALNYNVNVESPLTYVITLLKLVAADVELSDFESFYSTCLDILNFVFMKRDEVYGSILIDRNEEGERNQQIVVLEANYILLACGVIAAATELSNDHCRDHLILLALSRRTSIRVEMLRRFQANVKKCVIKSKESIQREEATTPNVTPNSN